MKQSNSVMVLDPGGGNVGSMVRALEHVGGAPRVVQDRPAGPLGPVDRIVLPGVGHFGRVMHELRNRGFDDWILEHVASGRPFLGVCIGLQVLFESSEEAEDVRGLGILAGRVTRFLAPKVPQVGFNRVEPSSSGGLLKPGYFYFVNAFHCVPRDASVVAATADYHGEFVAAVAVGSVLAVQFHPEKSGPPGLALLRRWLSC